MCRPPQPPELALPSPAMSGHGLPSSRHVPPSTGRGCSGPRAAWGPGAASLRCFSASWARALGGAAGGGQGPGWAPRSAKGRRRRAWAPRRGCQGAAVHLPPGSPRCHPCLHQGRRTHGPPRPPSLASCPAAAVRILSVTPWGPAHSGDCPGCSSPANLGYLSSLSSSPPPASALFVTPLCSSFLSVTFRQLRLGSACFISPFRFPLCRSLINFVTLRHCPSVPVTFRQFSPLSVALRRPLAPLGSSPSGIVYFRHSPSLSGCSLPRTPWRKPQGLFLPLVLFRHSPILLSLQSPVISGLPVTLSSSLHSWVWSLLRGLSPLPGLTDGGERVSG
ncbi:uncharacterized protein [Symphalangus syndactylus]|uniref:uncharacterized protein isoform X2 n=1 Tax=Symphalangus syndactylus TaxID=9590 RepID=UPI003007A7AF